MSRLETRYRIPFTVILDGAFLVNAVDEEVAKDIAKNGVKFEVKIPKVTDNKVVDVWISNIFKPKFGTVEEDEDYRRGEDTWELCPFCEEEVMLQNVKKFEPQPCPNCGRKILPCSLCTEEDIQYCDKCPVVKYRKKREDKRR